MDVSKFDVLSVLYFYLGLYAQNRVTSVRERFKINKGSPDHKAIDNRNQSINQSINSIQFIEAKQEQIQAIVP